MLRLLPLDDKAALADLYRDPYIARVGHDHRPAAPIEHPAARYLGAWVADQFVGAFLIIESGFIEWDVHSLLTRKALPWCRDLGRMCAAWCFDHPIERITCYVLEGLESARNFCRRLGFVDEGFRRDAYMIGGQLRGVYVLGLTRRDWSAR